MEQEIKDILGVSENEKNTFNDKNNYEGSGAEIAKKLASIFYIISGFLLFVGIILLLNWEGRSYHIDYLISGLICISLSISFFVVAPIYKCLGTIAEAAQLFKQKNQQ